MKTEEDTFLALKKLTWEEVYTKYMNTPVLDLNKSFWENVGWDRKVLELKMCTEEDTFNRLCRSTFIEVHKIYNDMLVRSITGFGIDEVDKEARRKMLKEHGWTHAEYVVARKADLGF